MYLLVPALFFLQASASLKAAHQFEKRQYGTCTTQCGALSNFGADCFNSPDSAECHGCTSEFINEIASCYGCLVASTDYGNAETYQEIVDSLVQECHALGFNIPDPKVSSNNSPSTPSSSKAPASTLHAPPSSQSTTVKNSDPHIGYYPPNAWSTVSGTSSSSASLNVPSCSDSGELKESSTKGSNISYSFAGSGISVHTVTSSLGGAYTVSLDGSSPQTLDDYNPSAAANSPTCSIPFTAASLNPNGQHTIVIQFIGQSPNAAAAGAISAGQFDFDAFVVTAPVSTSSAGEFRLNGNWMSLLALGLATVLPTLALY